MFGKKYSAVRVGIAGSGFMAGGILRALQQQGFGLGPVLTRRPLNSVKEAPHPEVLTNSLAELIEGSDVIVICTGDSIHGTEVLEAAFQAGLPVVTLDSELQITTGSWFVGKGILSEAEGDQPGSLAALRRDALAMGFEPLVYGNVKGFLNRTPTVEDMQYWSRKQGISPVQTTSFTDGTKLQIEQALVANAFEATVLEQGMLGPKTENVARGSQLLSNVAEYHGGAISDYVICPGFAGVFIGARHEEAQRSYLSYLKMGDGPFYTLLRHFHLCHLEVPKTVREVVDQGESGILMNNGAKPRYSVAAIAKQEMPKDHPISHAIGSFDLRGEAVAITDIQDHVPIGLIQQCRTTRHIEPGEIIRFKDVELPESRALEIWRDIAAGVGTPTDLMQA